MPTHFSFTVPDNLGEFSAAKVVLLGKKTGQITPVLKLSISENFERHDLFTDSLTLPSVTVVKDEFLELDVSAIFPTLIPGIDYVSLRFKTGRFSGE